MKHARAVALVVHRDILGAARQRSKTPTGCRLVDFSVAAFGAPNSQSYHAIQPQTHITRRSMGTTTP